MPEAVFDMGERYNSHRELRVWKPGDGLTCSFASRASRNRPCGPPVAVRHVVSHPTSTRPRQHREVICAYHLSDQCSPGGLSLEAETAAREKVIVAHWDEYQTAVREFMAPLVEAMIGNLPEELKLLVLDALARYDRVTTPTGPGPGEGEPHLHPGQFGGRMCHDHDGHGYHCHDRIPPEGVEPYRMYFPPVAGES